MENLEIIRKAVNTPPDVLGSRLCGGLYDFIANEFIDGRLSGEELQSLFGAMAKNDHLRGFVPAYVDFPITFEGMEKLFALLDDYPVERTLGVSSLWRNSHFDGDRPALRKHISAKGISAEALENFFGDMLTLDDKNFNLLFSLAEEADGDGLAAICEFTAKNFEAIWKQLKKQEKEPISALFTRLLSPGNYGEKGCPQEAFWNLLADLNYFADRKDFSEKFFIERMLEAFDKVSEGAISTTVFPCGNSGEGLEEETFRKLVQAAYAKTTGPSFGAFLDSFVKKLLEQMAWQTPTKAEKVFVALCEECQYYSALPRLFEIWQVMRGDCKGDLMLDALAKSFNNSLLRGDFVLKYIPHYRWTDKQRKLIADKLEKDFKNPDGFKKWDELHAALKYLDIPFEKLHHRMGDNLRLVDELKKLVY